MIFSFEFRFRKLEPKIVSKIPVRNNPTFSRTLSQPIFEPDLVPKQPQEISNPLNKLISIARIKIPNNAVRMNEFSLTETPNKSNNPDTTSTQGNVKAKRLTNDTGRSL